MTMCNQRNTKNKCIHIFVLLHSLFSSHFLIKVQGYALKCFTFTNLVIVSDKVTVGEKTTSRYISQTRHG